MESTHGRSAEERRTAFEAISVPLMKTLYNRALNLCRRTDVAADLVQETYLRAFRTFENFEPGSNAKAWLLTILYSVFVSRYRKEQRDPLAASLNDADLTEARAPESHELLDPKLWASEQVNSALRRLSDSFRIVLLMVDVDDMSYEEVATALQCPVGTVRSRLSRARKLLYAELVDYARAQGFGERKS
jgi:RNA polymerase sigma-70 factor (ECF subfamily)